ncbi:MAG: hypothetical protein FWF77_03565 [Defluviitaleaceae bacterium]|nr:hypothetical protein [Defluviitaleaceae bacterium]
MNANPQLKIKKARQARIGHRGHMSAATHSLEAGWSAYFRRGTLAHKKPLKNDKWAKSCKM